jgi:hypothetical protein
LPQLVPFVTLLHAVVLFVGVQTWQAFVGLTIAEA